jgi:hypothetical protein
MPDDTDQSAFLAADKRWLAVYLVAWILFAVVGWFGNVLHMSLALDGPGITYFGAEAGTGAAYCYAAVFAGFILWLISRGKVELQAFAVGLGLSVAAFLAFLPVWRTTLGASWSYACWQNDDAYACHSLGDLSGVMEWTDTEQPAHRRGCELGAQFSCRWLMEDDASTLSRDETCTMLQETCRRWRRCDQRDRTTKTCRRLRQAIFIRPGYSCDMHEESCEP